MYTVVSQIEYDYLNHGYIFALSSRHLIKPTACPLHATYRHHNVHCQTLIVAVHEVIDPLSNASSLRTLLAVSTKRCRVCSVLLINVYSLRTL